MVLLRRPSRRAADMAAVPRAGGNGLVPHWIDNSPEPSPMPVPVYPAVVPTSGGLAPLPSAVLWSPPVQALKSTIKRGTCKVVPPNHFEPEQHYYPRVLNAQIHPLVASFMQLGNERIIARYCHLNPQVNPQALRAILSGKTHYFRWAGALAPHARTH